MCGCLLQAKFDLYDVCYQQSVNYATSLNREFGCVFTVMALSLTTARWRVFLCVCWHHRGWCAEV